MGKEMEKGRRPSKGERAHIRKVKAAVRGAIDPFKEEEDKAMKALWDMVGVLPADQENLLRNWWHIRRAFATTHNQETFDLARNKFNPLLDGIDSPLFFTALRFITNSFTQPG